MTNIAARITLWEGHKNCPFFQHFSKKKKNQFLMNVYNLKITILYLITICFEYKIGLSKFLWQQSKTRPQLSGCWNSHFWTFLTVFRCLITSRQKKLMRWLLFNYSKKITLVEDSLTPKASLSQESLQARECHWWPSTIFTITASFLESMIYWKSVVKMSSILVEIWGYGRKTGCFAAVFFLLDYTCATINKNENALPMI